MIIGVRESCELRRIGQLPIKLFVIDRIKSAQNLFSFSFSSPSSFFFNIIIDY